MSDKRCSPVLCTVIQYRNMILYILVENIDVKGLYM